MMNRFSPHFRGVMAMLAVIVVAGVMACSLGGCATTSANGTTVTTAPTMNDATALAYDAITFAQTLSTTAYQAGKITLAQAQANHAKLLATFTAVSIASTVVQVQQQQAAANAVTTSLGGTPK